VNNTEKQKQREIMIALSEGGQSPGQIATMMGLDIQAVRYAIDPDYKKTLDESRLKANITRRRKAFSKAMDNSVQIVKSLSRTVLDQPQGRPVPVVISEQEQIEAERRMQKLWRYDIRRFDRKVEANM
jgi:hypothetical protein